jgi:hypothetical protein
VRTYGRIYTDGVPQWVEVTDVGEPTSDYIWITTLIQNLKLILGESPFFANYGLPSEQAVIQQIAPDYHVSLTQQRFSQYFASLIISRIPGSLTPTYRVNILTRAGTRFQEDIAV